MRRWAQHIAALAAALMCVVTAGGAARADAAFKATVTLDGVHYTLPTYFKDHALEPRRPLCHTFEYATIVIVVRDLFINGQLMYRGRAGDDVVVRYPYEVQVNGRPVSAPQPGQTLDRFPCTGPDFQ